jgi:hypothetical protein
MKKLLVVFSLILSTAFSYATNSGKSNHAFGLSGKNCFIAGIVSKSKINGFVKISKYFSCSVTLTASVGYSATYVSASCTSTKNTCDEAITAAANCVKSAIAQAKKVIK